MFFLTFFSQVYSENLANHRALQLQRILPIALRHGASEIEPDIEPLKVFLSVTSSHLKLIEDGDFFRILTTAPL